MPKPFRLEADEPSEAQITKEIRRWLDFKRIWHWKEYQSMGSYPGVSDILGVGPFGKILAIEVKRESGRLSERQAKFQNNVIDRGGIALVARSVGDVIEVIEELEVTCPHCGEELK